VKAKLKKVTIFQGSTVAKVRVPEDLVAGYAWLMRTVLGLEDQSIPTVNRPAYGNDEAIPLALVKGWKPSEKESETETFPQLYAEVRSDHVIVSGYLRWEKGTSDRAAVLPGGIAPLEEYMFTSHREDGSPITIRVTPSGFLMIPKGSTAGVFVSVRYPAPRGGG
jgi:hypothetical protein